MKYDFDTVIDRTNNFAAKYDEIGLKFGREDLVPLWVADMDFRTAEPIIEAIRQRAEQGIFGYTSRPKSYFAAVSEWLSRRHGWSADPSLMLHSPGVVPSLSMMIQHFTEPGDKIIIQSPVYYPFFDVVRSHGRQLLENPLKNVNGRYEMDYDHLAELAAQGAKYLLLCSPHNPVGRVWHKDELVRLGQLCLRHGVTVIADEIHSDLVYSAHKHIPFASISEEFRQNTITCIAPSKTFNLAGLQASIVIFPNREYKARFDAILGNLDIRRNNCFSLVAVEAAYRQGEEWLEQVNAYIKDNFAYIGDFCRTHIPEIKPNEPEGTYLVWLDCRELGLNRTELHDFMLNEAKLALDDGFWFSEQADGYMRLNAACPRSILTKALTQLKQAIAARRDKD
ncbi:MalY/PatB family protein [Propionispora vibrioides]|uniref:cysteine-S-conjugate beta-lyase n=1 Tax=Propionispora vibrioides TaxID=112903 RepID=A0A1H8WRY1_9FIRM|nr:MalY/PatB family protein [Propionispora vibrioides]SEP30369.1 cystathione beta-lyase [Propionispora vibrioides]